MRAQVTFEPTLEVRRERITFADAFFQFGESASFSVHPVTGELLFIKPNEAQQQLTLVVNFDLPNEPEAYIHRGRASRRCRATRS